MPVIYKCVEINLQLAKFVQLVIMRWYRSNYYRMYKRNLAKLQQHTSRVNLTIVLARFIEQKFANVVYTQLCCVFLIKYNSVGSLLC